MILAFSTWDAVSTVVAFLAAWLVVSAPVALLVARMMSLKGPDGVPEGDHFDMKGFLGMVIVTRPGATTEVDVCRRGR